MKKITMILVVMAVMFACVSSLHAANKINPLEKEIFNPIPVNVDIVTGKKQ